MLKCKWWGFLVITICSNTYICNADTINIDWNIDNETIFTTQCNIGDALILPQPAPQKYGYTFVGWQPINMSDIEYVDSTGAQWLDTKYIITSENVKYVWRAIDYGGGSLFGSQAHGNFTGTLYQTNARDRGLYVGNIRAMPSNYIIDSKIHEYEMHINSGIVTITQDGMLILNSTYSGNLDKTRSVSLFGIHGEEYAKWRLYYFKMYDNDVLVRDMIPIIDSHGNACLYDKISQQILCSSSTQRLVPGPHVWYEY